MLYLVERAKIFADINADEDGTRVSNQRRKEARKYWKRAQDFFDSFNDIKDGLWDLLTQPHRKNSGDDMNEFIAHEDEESESDADEGGNHRAMMMENIRQQEAQERAEDIEKVRRFQAQALGEEDDSDSVGDEMDEEEAYYAQNDESSVDEWEKDLLSKRRKSTSPSSTKNKRLRSQRSKEPKDESESEQDFLEVSSSSGTSPAKIMSFDDTDDEDGSTNKNHSPTKKHGRLQKRKIVDDDDDDE